MSERCVCCQVHYQTRSDLLCDYCRNNRRHRCDGCGVVGELRDMRHTEDGQLICQGCCAAAARAADRRDHGDGGVQACRVCGCTDDDCSGCIERTGQPCHWVEPDLCSACVAGVPS